MNREESLKEADRILEDLIKSGDSAIFDASRSPDGIVKNLELVAAAMRAREKLADIIIRDSESARKPQGS